MQCEDNRESAAKRGYGRKWQKQRAAYLAKHPLCVFHQNMGQTEAATVVDHIIPHKGNQKLFWSYSNWQSLCKSCHDRHKKRQEHRGLLAGCDDKGTPTDPLHHWNEG